MLAQIIGRHGAILFTLDMSHMHSVENIHHIYCISSFSVSSNSSPCTLAHERGVRKYLCHSIAGYLLGCFLTCIWEHHEMVMQIVLIWTLPLANDWNRLSAVAHAAYACMCSWTYYEGDICAELKTVFCCLAFHIFCTCTNKSKSVPIKPLEVTNI